MNTRQHYTFKNADDKVVVTRRPTTTLKGALEAVDPYFIGTTPPTHYKQLPDDTDWKLLPTPHANTRSHTRKHIRPRYATPPQ